MRFLGILLLDALFLLALFFSGSAALKDKTFGAKVGIYFIGLALFYAWSIGVYYSIQMIIRG